MLREYFCIQKLKTLVSFVLNQELSKEYFLSASFPSNLIYGSSVVTVLLNLEFQNFLWKEAHSKPVKKLLNLLTLYPLLHFIYWKTKLLLRW